MKLTAGQHVVITGGSSGLGLELAHQLAARGLQLTLVARGAVKLESAKDEIMARAPRAKVGVLVADVSDHEPLEQAFATLAEHTWDRA
jgi:short-subunit dehydrogenase